MPLYLVATPIGNLGDITIRALDVLRESDLIYCEDTRVSAKLLSHYDIKKPLRSYHVHSPEGVIKSILKELELGKNISYVSDAGLPCISDPGKKLVLMAVENGIEYTVVPGPSAVDTAYAGSIFLDKEFVFVGFPDKKNRKKQFEELKNLQFPMVFYESPHRVEAVLRDMLSIFGNRKVSVGRELTKFYETYIHSDLESILEDSNIREPRGEFVIVLEGYKKQDVSLSSEEIFQLAKARLEAGEKISKIAKELSAKGKLSRQEIYVRLSKNP